MMMSNRRCVVLQPSKNPCEPSFEITDTAVPEKPLGDNVLLKVLACGICHADSICVLGSMDVQYPAVPGHEVIGEVVKVGAGDIASTFTEGTIVGVGWHGDHCLSCEACSDGDFICCQRQKVCGAHIPGGYQQYMVASARALARVPKEMDPVTAAPIMCAGVTVFNSLRTHNDKAKPPALVAVVGIGGLGHLAIQYGVKMGYTVAAISRGKQKKDYALKLGATHYIDSEAENASDALKALGKAKIILCTATNSKVMADCIDGLGRNGKLILLGVGQDPIPVMSHQLIPNRCSIVGHASGNPRDSQDALEFAKLHGIVPKTVVFDGIDEAPEAYSAMMKGEHRVVIKVADE